MIDIVMTASIRPMIVQKTLLSIKRYIDYRPLRLIVDVAPVGDPAFTQQDVVDVIKTEFNSIGHLCSTTRVLSDSPQAEALKWTWRTSSTDFVLQWEDDWVLRKELWMDDVLRIMKGSDNLGMLYFDRYKKSILDYPGYEGVFSKVYNNWASRVKGKSLGGPPAILQQRYIKKVLPILKDNVCLDTLSPTRIAQAVLHSFVTGVYVGLDRKGNYVEDIGKAWRKQHNLKMVKKTDRGVTWIKY